jgi:hypothetical protein
LKVIWILVTMTVFRFMGVTNQVQKVAYPYSDVPKVVMVLMVEREE